MPPLLKRVLVLIGSIFAIVTLNFFLFHVIPGDPIRLIARSQHLTPEAVACYCYERGFLQVGDQCFVNWSGSRSSNRQN